MPKHNFLVDIDANLNQGLNWVLENNTGISAGTAGREIWDTNTSRIAVDNGSAIKQVAYLDDLTGALFFMGGYNATTNTPDLTTSPNAILTGQFWVITVAGTFFGEQVEVGDSLIAKVDNPSSLADWVIVQGNTVPASETVAGVIAIATQAEVNTGTNDTKAVTPLKLKNASYLQNLAHTYTSGVVSVGGTGSATTITHNLNNANPGGITIKNAAGEVVTLAINNFTANSFDVNKNGPAADFTVNVVG